MIRTAALLLAVISAGPTSAATRNHSVTSFDRIRVEGPFAVSLRTGVPPFARTEGSNAAMDAVSIAVQGRTLIIRPNRSSWGGYPGQQAGPVTISVGTPDLTTAVVNGSGSLTIDRVKGLQFDLAVQGSGSAVIEEALVDRMSAGLSGSASARLAGKALRLTAIVRGTSTLEASGLGSRDATLAADGPSVLKASVSNSAKVDAAGTASVSLEGGAACTVKALGSATVSGCRLDERQRR